MPLAGASSLAIAWIDGWIDSIATAIDHLQESHTASIPAAVNGKIAMRVIDPAPHPIQTAAAAGSAPRQQQA